MLEKMNFDKAFKLFFIVTINKSEYYCSLVGFKILLRIMVKNRHLTCYGIKTSGNPKKPNAQIKLASF
jgi:hypothetical protein